MLGSPWLRQGSLLRTRAREEVGTVRALPDEDLFPWGSGVICGYCAEAPAVDDSAFCSQKCRRARAKELGLNLWS
jgi:hypothetical protein